jgi:hypothetical protein
MVLCSSFDGVPLKIRKEKWPGIQFMRTDYLSLVLTLVRIRWTLQLSICCLSMKTACCLSVYIFLTELFSGRSLRPSLYSVLASAAYWASKCHLTDKKSLMEGLDTVLLAVDEICDQVSILKG